MEVTGYIAAVLIGISLGLMGGGGSILTVPVMVYLMHVHPVIATMYSLFVVGSCSLVGGTRAYFKGLINFSTVLYFGASSMIMVFLVRHYVVPEIPDVLFSVGKLVITKGVFMMLLFALLMLAASFSMIRSNNSDPSPAGERSARKGALVVQGILVGAITGLLGAGGGFLIIPALVLFSRLPMKIAIGSSLTIMALSSLFGFFTTFSHYTINWLQLLLFTAIAISGIFIGAAMADKIQGSLLKKGFGWFVLAMGVYILIKEIFFSGI